MGKYCIASTYPGLQLVLGTEVEEKHPAARMCKKLPDYAAWIDARYSSVFTDDRFVIDSCRLDRLKMDLSSSERYHFADAEVQAAATLLNVSEILIHADEEGGKRASDYWVEFDGQPIDVEIRIVQEDLTSKEIDAATDRLRKRLENDLSGFGIFAILKVERIRIEEKGKGLALDPKTEKGFARKILEVASSIAEENVCVTLGIDGIAKVATPGTSRYGELAFIEIRAYHGLSGPMVMCFPGPMSPLPESERIYRALRKKSGRKQRTEGRPWVVVLNTTNTLMFDFEEMQEGAHRYFSGSKGNMSAVVIQNRSYFTSGFGNPLESNYAIGFDSKVIPNPKAQYPLSGKEIGIFKEKIVIPACPPV